jgi:uncharacterized membrane protein
MIFLPLAASSSYAKQTVSLYNHTETTWNLALIYKGYDGMWIAKGWWLVRPGQHRDIHLPSNNNVIYTYSKSNNGRFYNGNGKTGSVNQVIVNEAFDVRHGDRPAGTNPKRVSFRKRVTSNNWMEVTWR